MKWPCHGTWAGRQFNAMPDPGQAVRVLNKGGGTAYFSTLGFPELLLGLRIWTR